jgi:flagellar biosynthesis protein FlhG
VINNAQNLEEATEAADQLKAAARHFLGKDLDVLGLVPSDRHLLQAVREQRSVVELYPDSPAGTALRAMAESLAERVVV